MRAPAEQSRPNPAVAGSDVAWFGAEVGVYGCVAVWAATRALPTPARILFAGAAVVVMAVLWGSFAAPHAARRLTGAAGVAFRAGWFGGGLLALLGLLL